MKGDHQVSRKLMWFMMGFGLLMGIIFPFFTRMMLDAPPEQVFSPLFFGMCIGAGLVVGLVNYTIFRNVIYSFLFHMNEKILLFKERLAKSQREGVISCSAEDCFVDVISEDRIVGNIANSFNDFIRTIQNLFRSELTTDEFLEKLKQSMKTKDVADIVVGAFVEYFGADGGCVLGFDRGEVNVLSNLGVQVEAANLDRDSLYRIMTVGRPVLVERLEKDAVNLNIVVGEIRPSAIAFVPLKYQEKNVGMCLLLTRTEFSRNFNSIESRNFVSQGTPFLYNSTLIKRLEILAAIDELTGVLNRRFGMRRLNEEFERSRRHSIPLSVCMLDIDHFKQVNDTYGHQGGDFVLRTLSELLSQSVRVSDFVMRYGGEEFLIAVPGASMSDARAIMERIRRQVETLRLQYGAYELSFTFSGGIASFPAPGVNDVEGIIQKADAALYKAKENGRNQLVIAG